MGYYHSSKNGMSLFIWISMDIGEVEHFLYVYYPYYKLFMSFANFSMSMLIFSWLKKSIYNNYFNSVILETFPHFVIFSLIMFIVDGFKCFAYSDGKMLHQNSFIFIALFSRKLFNVTQFWYTSYVRSVCFEGA